MNVMQVANLILSQYGKRDAFYPQDFGSRYNIPTDLVEYAKRLLESVDMIMDLLYSRTYYKYSNITESCDKIIQRDNLTNYDNARRPIPLWMSMNRLHKKCWCGKPKELFQKGRRKHCTAAHADTWTFSINASWNMLRSHVVHNQNYTCELCNHHDTGQDYEMQVDHIVAKCLGGDPWIESNLQVLCQNCHKAKTKQDKQELAKLNKTKKQTTLDINTTL